MNPLLNHIMSTIPSLDHIPNDIQRLYQVEENLLETLSILNLEYSKSFSEVIEMEIKKVEDHLEEIQDRIDRSYVI